MRVRTAPVALAALFALIFLSNPAGACMCVELPSVSNAVAESDAVFAGTVTAVEHEAGSPWVQVSVSVEQSWKGAATGVVTFLDTAISRCAVGFEVGQQYLVYCYASSDPEASLQTSGCTRSGALSSAGADLAALGAPE
jgi:hypothetical protein